MTPSCLAPLPHFHTVAMRCMALCMAIGFIAAVTRLDAAEPSLVDRFPMVQSILVNRCQTCHAGEKHEGEFDLQRYSSIADVRADVTLWQQMATAVRQGEMPPPESLPLSDADRTILLQWIDDFIKHELQQATGDPGPTILRRLNAAEYTYTIQDLTGVPLEPASEFPAKVRLGKVSSTRVNRYRCRLRCYKSISMRPSGSQSMWC